MENPIKAFIQRRAEEQERLAKAQSSDGQKGVKLFTADDQRKTLHMSSVQSQFNFDSTGNDEYELNSLYDILTSGEYKEKLTPGLFPEVLIKDGITYLPSNRYVRLDKIRTQFEWYVSISKTKGNSMYLINPDYHGSYVELYPDGYLLHFTATTLHSSFVTLSDVYDLSTTKYYRVAVVDDVNEKIKSIANDYSNVDRWNAKPPEADKVYYVPKGLDRSQNQALWSTIDGFVNFIKEGDKMKLSTTMVGGSNANTCMY